uniref:Predicted protein n=1 Tax=Hordeum vulgare subsp. vulgare TaxID=112509 RepID=F2CZ43_HORVV|nr:predicted protein [Hordeum vulgare subsp. vulgare]
MLLLAADLFLVWSVASVVRDAARGRRRRWLLVMIGGRLAAGCRPPCSAFQRHPAHDPFAALRRVVIATLVLLRRAGEAVLVHHPVRARLAAVEGERRLDADEQPLANRQLHEHRLLLPRGLPVPAGRSPPPPATTARRRLPQAEEVCRFPLARACSNQLETERNQPDELHLHASIYACVRGRSQENAPGRSQGSGKAAAWTTGMTAAGSGRSRAMRRRYCSSSSKSVGWNRNPGGSSCCVAGGASPAARVPIPVFAGLRCR